MFAVIKTGGKQYRVATEDVIRVDRVNGQPGEIVEFGEVLVVGGDAPQLGSPTVAGATVAGEVLQHTRGDKVIAFKKRRRKNSRRKRGYRHEFSVVRITEILTGGAKPSKTAAPRPKRERRPPPPVSDEPLIQVETQNVQEAPHAPADERTPATLDRCVDAAIAEYTVHPDFTHLGLGADEAQQFFADCRSLAANYMTLEDPRRVKAIGLELRLEASVGELALGSLPA